jgi:hypothetical protein
MLLERSILANQALLKEPESTERFSSSREQSGEIAIMARC